MCTSQLNQLREIRCSKPSNRIPTFRDRETFNVASMAEALGNISKALVPLLVQPRVQETQGGLATRQQRIVD
jgi:hypothetical protein